MTTNHTGIRARLAAWLAGRLGLVQAVEVGRPGDGLVGLEGAGGRLDPSWTELSEQLGDALEAWRRNPLARRLVGLVTAYVVGDGIRLSSPHRGLAQFLAGFTGHPQNLLDLRQASWCDTLSISGELFVSLHTNRADGMSYVRVLPAAAIDRVISRPGDYEAELAYHEAVATDDPDYPQGRTWLSPWHPDADTPGPDGNLPPVMLHFAVNRPVGCLRGESDLAPILPWLKRYARWLEDRVRLNAAVRAFLWIVRVPARLVGVKSEQYRRPPEPGSVIVAERENEEWQAVAPDLKAGDAAADGRAIRWMIVSGGLGTSLVDVGEATDANLATARSMAEQRARFMRGRQTYFGFVLAQTALTAYNRAVQLGKVRGRERTLADIEIAYPDISPADNADLAAAAAALASALQTVGATGYGGERWRRTVLRLVLKFAGESLSDDELAALAEESR